MVDALRRRWGVVVIAILLCALFYHVAIDFKVKWDLPDSYYSHGYLILPIVAFLVYRKRNELARLAPEPCAWGLALLMAGCLMRLVGAYSRINFVSGFSLIPVLLGVVLYVWGRRVFAELLFALLFLVAMVPAPVTFINRVSFRMKMIAANGAVGLLDMFNAGLVLSGSTVEFWRDGKDSLVVGDVCSGLRSLIALLAFGALFAYISEVSMWKKLVLFLVTIPTALVANLVRIVFIILAAMKWGSDAVVDVNYLKKLGLGGIAGDWGTLHDISGILIYIVAFVLLFSVEKLLARIGAAKTAAGEGAE